MSNLYFIVIRFELNGRIRLIREFGHHWSILTGDECFIVFEDNLNTLAQAINEVSLNDNETTKSKMTGYLIIFSLLHRICQHNMQ